MAKCVKCGGEFSESEKRSGFNTCEHCDGPIIEIPIEFSKELVLRANVCKLSQINLTGWNPRKSFDPAELEELKKSIQAHGILEPLVVRYVEIEGKGRLDLVAGERRYKAAQELGLKEVPIVVKELTDAQVREIMLVENLQRSGLEPLEEAASLEALLKDGSTQEELAKKLGKSQGWIANRLRLLKAPKEIKDLIISRKITAKHALTLLPLAKFPIFKVLQGDLKDALKEDEELTISKMEGIVRGRLTYGDGKESVLNLDQLPYQLEDLKKFLDLSACKACEDVVLWENWGGKKNRYCLNFGCHKAKIGLAKEKQQAHEKRQAELLKGKAVVDKHKLDYSNYSGMRGVRWDTTECKTCENLKKDLDKNPICLKPSCYKKKQAVQDKIEQEKEEEERRISLLALDGWLEKKKELTWEDLKLILSALAEAIYYGDESEALRPWRTKEDEAVSKTLEKIPEKDLPKAVIRMALFSYYQDVGDMLKEYLPEVWKERVKLAKQTKPIQLAGVPTPAGSPKK